MLTFAPYYYFVYWLVVLIMTMSVFNRIQSKQNYAVIYTKDNYNLMIFFCVFFILFFGLRPVSFHFGDTVMYNARYKLMQEYGLSILNIHQDGSVEASENVGSDWLFFSVMFLCAKVMSVNFFFLIVMCFYVVMMFLGCRKIDYRHVANT